MKVSTSAGWNDYWEQLREGQQAFREQAEEYARALESTVAPASDDRVLDFGCGFGFVADFLASRVGHIYLWDASANMRAHARANTAHHRNVHLIDLSDPAAGAASGVAFDLILVNSVLQYMRPDEAELWISRWRALLAPEGQIVLSDLIPPGHRLTTDLRDLLRFLARRRLLSRLLPQASAELRRYWAARTADPLSRVSPEDLSRWAEKAGLGVQLLPRNLTHFTARYSALLTRDDGEPPRRGAGVS